MTMIRTVGPRLPADLLDASQVRVTEVLMDNSLEQRLAKTSTTSEELRLILGNRMVDQLVGLPSKSAAMASTASSLPEAAGRIELIGQIVWCLMGTYDAQGIRRWFGRRRSQLKGRTPADLLAPGWVADSTSAKRILELAKELV